MGHLLPILVAELLLLLCGALGDDDSNSTDVPSHETASSDLPGLLDTEEGIRHLYQEFAGIEGGQRRPWTVAALPENIKKNRYDDLLAFDHSRVVLDKLPDDEHSDYINANYLDGYHGEREYVATQGPLPDTIDDFWRMIWQLNATRIIMLANVLEHGQVKVEQYWPSDRATYGDVEVFKLLEYSVPELQHVVRTFSLKKSGVAAPRLVRQFHFTGWPDLGVPNDTFPVISIVHQARKYDPQSRAPLVVHCSAGIGRTGTVILMDSMLQRAKAEGLVDFPKRLDHMRTLRPDMVEKKEQYVFAHRAVSDAVNDPEVKERLRRAEEEYRRLDDLLGADDLVPPRATGDVLLKMRGRNNAMRVLIDNLIQQTGLDQ